MNLQTLKLSISDMHCSSCPKLINVTLSEIPGVISANANLETKQAVVDYDSDSVTADRLIKVIAEIGYTATTL